MNKIIIALAFGLAVTSPAHAGAGDCMATFTRNREWGASTQLNPTGSFYHRGETVALTGGSQDPKIFCQHGGYCAPVAAIKFNRPCRLKGDDAAHGGPYYSWYPTP